MQRILKYTITEPYINYTIEKFLLEQGYTRKIITHLKKYENSMTLNDKWAYVKNKLSLNDILVVTLTEPIENNIVPVKLDFKIIYEDEDILIVNKPAFMPIHPSLNNYDNTLANALTYYFQSKKESVVFRCITRLDRDTTGLCIIAKNKLSASILNAQTKNRQIHKTYIAICEGEVNDCGEIEAPISRKEESVITRCVDFEKGDYSKTLYKKLRYNKKADVSLVQLKLLTGRTHQIRVHMKYINHPLIGDFLYNPNNTLMNRQALHSYKLSFIHPISHEKMDFMAPIPNDMQTLL
ncbi:RluA family pseudouridine synthase [Lachnobacterium bovis]|uniref:RluA family pseudouridine synthase n=1 Tax=Lachnobacterium bovis TaxID=140626 RepID=UPI0003B32738|nr:RluA family pseudouridine synthase [Lachnobacterium bovis]